MKSLCLFLVTVLIAAVVASCTVQRRLYKPGFHIEWHKRYKQEEIPQSKAAVVCEKAKALVGDSSALAITEPIPADSFRSSVLSSAPQVPARDNHTIQRLQKLLELSDRFPDKMTNSRSFAKKRSVSHDSDVAEVFIVSFMVFLTVLFLALIVFGIVALFALESPLTGIILLGIATAMITPLIIGTIIDRRRMKQRQREDRRQEELENNQQQSMSGSFRNRMLPSFLKSTLRRDYFPSAHTLLISLIIILSVFALIFFGCIGFGIWALLTLSSPVLGIILLAIPAAVILLAIVLLLYYYVGDIIYSRKKRKLEREAAENPVPVGFRSLLRGRNQQLKNTDADQMKREFLRFFIITVILFLSLLGFGIWALLALASPVLGIIMLSIAASMILLPLAIYIYTLT